MKRGLKLAASVLLVLGLALGVAISYNDRSMDHNSGFDGCPVYSSQSVSASNAARLDWLNTAANLGNRVAQPNGSRNVERRNFIDNHIFDAMEADKIPHANLCTDEEFLRRAYLDLTGRIPTPEQVKSFLSSPDRAALVDTLLQTPEYVDRMTMYFGDLLQNTYSLLYDGRNAYKTYIRTAVEENRPYDQIMRELITAEGDSWEDKAGAVNFLGRAWESMANKADTIDNITADIGRVFLGMPMMCVSCHNGRGHLEQVNLYLSQRTRYQFWNVAAFISNDLDYTRQNMGRNLFQYSFYPRPNGPTGGYNTTPSAETRNGVRPIRTPRPGDDALYPPVYFFNGETPKDKDFRGELARIIKNDKQFARATVNYIWKEFMGMGIVDAADAFDLDRIDPNNPPPDPWTLQPTNAALLNALAQDFIDHQFDLKQLIRTIMNSSAYQLSAEFPGEWEGRYANYFARHFVKRMYAESVLDTISQATGINLNYAIPAARGGEAQWAMQLPDPTEPNGNNPASNTAIRTFLDKFFRGSRDGSPRRSEGSIQQVLELTNNTTLIYNRIKANVGLVKTLLEANPENSAESNGALIDELFLATVSRYPTATEKSEALKRFASPNADRSRVAENVLYALVNKLDFLHY